jgi:hypothetical protein
VKDGLGLAAKTGLLGIVAVAVAVAVAVVAVWQCQWQCLKWLAVCGSVAVVGCSVWQWLQCVAVAVAVVGCSGSGSGSGSGSVWQLRTDGLDIIHCQCIQTQSKKRNIYVHKD